MYSNFHKWIAEFITKVYYRLNHPLYQKSPFLDSSKFCSYVIIQINVDFLIKNMMQYYICSSKIKFELNLHGVDYFTN